MCCTVAIVWPCSSSVEEYAAAGRAVRVPRVDCPDCGRPMGLWSGYERYLRLGRVHRVWVRRAKCRPCRVTHALVPSFVLLRRLDAVEVIGVALERAVAGAGLRPVAAGLDVPHTTARDWRRRFRARAPALAVGLAALVVELGGAAPALPAGSESPPWPPSGRPPGRSATGPARSPRPAGGLGLWSPAAGGWPPPRARPGRGSAGDVGYHPSHDPRREVPCPHVRLPPSPPAAGVTPR